MARLEDDRIGMVAPLEVDIAGLAEFARVLRAEQAQRFAPVASAAIEVFQSGDATVSVDPAFTEMFLACSAHQFSLDQAVRLLSAYSVALVALSEVADEVAKRYADSDALAGATVADLGGELAQLPRVPVIDTTLTDGRRRAV